MPRLTRRDGEGDGDLIACFGCDKVQEDTCECGSCGHFQAALERLCRLEELVSQLPHGERLTELDAEYGTTYYRRCFERCSTEQREDRDNCNTCEAEEKHCDMLHFYETWAAAAQAVLEGEEENHD